MRKTCLLLAVLLGCLLCTGLAGCGEKVAPDDGIASSTSYASTTQTQAPSPDDAASGASTTQAPPPYEPMFRGNLARTGEYPGPGPSGSPQLAWKFKIDGDGEPKSPTVSDGVVYFGGGNKLYALDAQSGRKRWDFQTSGQIFSCPAVSDGVVYFGCNDGFLYAVDSTSGQEKWDFQTDDEVTSSPVVSDGVVYFGSWDTYLYALDTQTGQEKWKFKTGDEVHSSPAISAGVVYFGSNDGYLYAVR